MQKAKASDSGEALMFMKIQTQRGKNYNKMTALK